MKLPFKSIRWRLQAWHGLLLFCVLLAFGLKAFSLIRENHFGAIDRELTRQTILVSATLPDTPQYNAIFSAVDQALAYQDTLDSEGRPDIPQRNAVRSIVRKTMVERLQLDLQGASGSSETNGAAPATEAGRLWERRENAMVLTMLASTEQAGFYYILWQADGTVLCHSANVPAQLGKPAPDQPGVLHLRIRDDFREQFVTSTNGAQLLVGCSITSDLACLHHLTLRITSIGGIIMLLGLVGGWWLSTRAIRPIKEITATATEIAGGQLTRRINLSDTDSELGQLANVLNASFDQLQAALNRQVQFTADASHELRTPISVVLAEANSALARPRTPAEYQEGFESCRRAARRMRSLAEALIKLARLDAGEQPGQREPCDLRNVAWEAITLLRPLAEERGVQLQADLADGPCLGDVEQLGQVAVNLISNAIQYNRTGGAVRVRVSSAGTTTILNVMDTGQGIAPEDLPHIFDRFYRADKARSNDDGHVGLGLAITKAIVVAHGGSIQAFSEAGAGSTFTVSLKRPPLSLQSSVATGKAG